MNLFSESLRTFVWFAVCVFMAVGMVVFALFYVALRTTLEKIAWKQISFPSLKLAK